MGEKTSRKLNNSGFSLVELLVAVAILSAVVAPIMRSFITTATTSAKAQSVQSATSVAEKTIETVKAKPGSELTFADVDVTDDTGAVLYTYPAARIPYLNQTATSGEKFDVFVEVTEQNYDKDEGQTDVSDINNVKLPELYSINSEEHAVISWEINNYDGSAVDNLAYKANVSKTSIKSDGIKTTYIKMTGGGSDPVLVNCDVEYKYIAPSDPSKVTRLNYTVYSKSLSDIAIVNGIKGSGGPHLYMFYKSSKQFNGTDYFGTEIIDIEDQTVDSTADPNKSYKQDMFIILQQKSVNGVPVAADMPTAPEVIVHGAAISPKVAVSGELYDSDELLNQIAMPDGTIGWCVPSTLVKHNYWEINSTKKSFLYTNFESFASTGAIDASLYESKDKKRIYNVNVKVYKPGTYTGTEWPLNGDGKAKLAELNSTMRVH